MHPYCTSLCWEDLHLSLFSIAERSTCVVIGVERERKQKQKHGRRAFERRALPRYEEYAAKVIIIVAKRKRKRRGARFSLSAAPAPEPPRKSAGAEKQCRRLTRRRRRSVFIARWKRPLNRCRWPHESPREHHDRLRRRQREQIRRPRRAPLEVRER